MKKIRFGTFETNSSSTHAIVVPHNVDEENYNVYDSLDHEYDFGRQESRLVEHWDEKLAYVYYVLDNFRGRYTVRKTDEGYGCNIKVTSKEINAFKNKVQEAYKEVIKDIKNKPYSNDPTPTDIFNIMDNENEYNKIARELKYKVAWDKEKKEYVYAINEEKDEYRPLTKQENEVYNLCLKLPELFNYGSIYVDHTEDFAENGFIEKIINADVEYIKRMIFNKDSYITIGGDEYRGYNIKTIGFQYDYKEDYVNNGTEECPQYEDIGEFWDKLKEYEKKNDVFLKGN